MSEFMRYNHFVRSASSNQALSPAGCHVSAPVLLQDACLCLSGHHFLHSYVLTTIELHRSKNILFLQHLSGTSWHLLSTKALRLLATDINNGLLQSAPIPEGLSPCKYIIIAHSGTCKPRYMCSPESTYKRAEQNH